MPIVGIDHVQLAMPRGGEDLARQFYGGVLGLSEVPKPPPLAARGGCWFESGAAKIHLGVDDDFRPGIKAHPGLIVRGISEIVARCREEGIKLIDNDPIEGFERVHVFDPFGNRIELMEPRWTSGLSP